MKKSYLQELYHISELLSIIIIISGIILLMGWLFNVPIFKSLSFLFPIKADAAICFIFIGISLWLLQTKRANQINIITAKTLALVVLIIGSLALIEYLKGINLGIDQILFIELPGTLNSSLPAHIASITALNLVLIGSSILTMDNNIKIRWWPLFQIIIIAEGLIAFLAVLGYIYHASNLYSYTGITAYTALTFCLIFFAVMFIRPDEGFIGSLLDERPGSVLGRRLLPVVILIPIVFGWITLSAQANSFYDSGLGYAILVFSTAIVIAILLWMSITSINKTDLKRRETENKLKRSESSLSEAQKIAHLGNWDWNLKTNCLHRSDEIYRIYMRDPEEFGMIYDSFLSYVHPEDREYVNRTVKNAINDMYNMEYPLYNIEYRIILPNGEERTVHEKAEPVYENSSPVRIIGTVQDITERKKTEEQLKVLVEELQRSNKELTSFAYITNHDLQEPLRDIASFTQLLERRYKGKLDSDADEFIGYIVDAAVRMKGMINGLLDYSYAGTRGNEFEEIDMNIQLTTALYNLKDLIHENNAEINYYPLPTVLADPGQMIRVFQNLIGNAIKFRKTDEPPKIHIYCEISKDNKEHIFSVSDNGIGIEKQYTDKIFEVFKKLHAISEYKGAGIGLSVVKKILERHGGRIWVESKYGQGSTFYFTIPLTGY